MLLNVILLRDFDLQTEQSERINVIILPFQVAGTIVSYELILVQFSAIHADERDLTAHSVAKRYCL